MTQTTLITGTNRGIGLELVKQYAEAGWHVLACCRNPQEAHELQALKEKHAQIEIHALDVCNLEQAKTLSQKLQNRPIDLLIHNAGIKGKAQGSLIGLDIEDLEEVFRVNAIAPVKITEIFLPHLEKSARKQIVQISSTLGSISLNTTGEYYAYRASKTAVNTLMKSAAIELAPRGIKIMMVHPGWVRTDMGGAEADIDVVTSVSGLLQIIEKHRDETGVFYRYSGEEMAW